MTSNLEKYKTDLENLINKGHQLLHSIQKEYKPDHYKEKWTEGDIKKLPNFRSEYQIWYSETLMVIKQLLPDRESDFVELYKKPKIRKEVNKENFRIADYLTGGEIYETTNIILEVSSILNCSGITTYLFHQQLKILESAQQRFESSLFDIKQLLQADLFDSELDVARTLNANGFIRGAGAVAGVVLENHLKQVCKNHKIKIKANSTIGNLNNLLKKENIIDIPKHRNIQLLADWRNNCTHDKEDTKPSKDIVTKLIKGVDEVIKTLF